MICNHSYGMGWDLFEGDFRDALTPVPVSEFHIITDPPYLSASATTGKGGQWKGAKKIDGSQAMEYEPASETLLSDLCAFASKATGWVIIFNDFDGAHFIRKTLKNLGAVVAEPIAWVKPPSLTPTRGSLNLPGKGTEFIVCARFASFGRERRIPGSYVSSVHTPPPCFSLEVTGGKPIDLMRSIIRDFTLPGDFIVDPFAGGGTTLLAALMEGRNAIGSEVLRKHFDIATKRLMSGYTPPLFTE